MGAVSAIVLFSGGLDSLLAAKLLESQGLSVRCLHFSSPFFGASQAEIARLSKLHKLEILSCDIGRQFAALLRQGPAHGYGKTLNPCVDCKILILREARRYLAESGAHFLATGEVLGQRPMSQRRDSLHLIEREAGVRGLLLRPLSAKHLPPTQAEEQGLVARDKFLDLSGRGRNAQLELAARFGLAEVPTPAGGCRLTERENARRYWQLLSLAVIGAGPGVQAAPCQEAEDFALAALGRQYWRNASPDAAYWLCLGRNQEDNQKLACARRAGDLLLGLCDCPGPLALARGGQAWPENIIREACALLLEAAPRARKQREAGLPLPKVRLYDGQTARIIQLGDLDPGLAKLWSLPEWEETRAQIRQKARVAGAARA